MAWSALAWLSGRRAMMLAVAIGGACSPSPESNADRPSPSGEAPAGDAPVKMTLTSTAFAHQGRIPKRFTGDGEDVSPALSWSGAPAETKELALIVDDPDAPTPEPWVHWVIYKIPASATGLAEGVPRSGSLSQPAGALQGENSWGEIGYRGPAPPRGHGVHHYHFKLYALDTALNLPAGGKKSAILSAMKGHILAEAEWIGTYQR